MAKKLKAEEDGVSPSEILSDAQIKKLLLYVTEKANLAKLKGTKRAIFDELIIQLLVNTGLRASELCNLNIADLPSNHNENTIWIRNVQGGVSRSIEVASELTKCIAMFVRLYREGANPNEPLLISERGKRFIYMSIYSKVKRIGQKAGIGKLYPHILRRTYLVRLYNDKQDLRFVQKQVGHASRKTTAMYVRTSIDHEQKVETMDTGDSSAAKSAEDFDIQAMDTLFKLQKAIEHEGSKYPQGSQQTVTCEACGKSISVEAGTMIDSGQVLCPDCLNELRKSRRHYV
jgi:integrase/recombinase XerD